MQYKIVKNEIDANDCKHCLFVDACVNICPLKQGWYFSDIRSVEQNYMREFGVELSRII